MVSENCWHDSLYQYCGVCACVCVCVCVCVCACVCVSALCPHAGPNHWLHFTFNPYMYKLQPSCISAGANQIRESRHGLTVFLFYLGKITFRIQFISISC